MQQRNVILGCYDKLKNNLFSKPKHYATQYATTTCHTMLLCKLANICGLNHDKYTSFEYIEICNIFEIEILRNTKLGVTPRCPSHRCLLRRGTPLTRSWFMPALNTQRFATVLTHPSTCFSHAEYHYCVTVYQSDLKSEIQSFARKIQNLLGLLCSP